MTAFYVADPAAHEVEALKTLDKAVELGLNFLDTVRWRAGASPPPFR